MRKAVLAVAALVGTLALAGPASADPHKPGWKGHRPHHPVCHMEWRHHHKVRVCR